MPWPSAMRASIGMKWFRSNIKHGSRLALFALALQLALSFGHFHGGVAQAAPAVQSGPTNSLSAADPVSEDARQQPASNHAADLESTSRKKRHGHILIRAAALFVIVNEFGSACRRYATDRLQLPGSIGHAWRGERYGIVKLSMSGEGRSARLESDAGGVQMSELGVSAQV